MNKKATKFAAITLAGALLVSPFLGANKAEASHKMDAVGNRYEIAVDFMAGKGYQGNSAIQFGVADKVTRADAAEMLAKSLDLNLNAPDSGFTDVSPEEAPYVNALKEAGITNGTTATTFGSDDILTRGQIAIWLTKGYDLPNSLVEVPFTDVSDRYHLAVSTMVEHGITNGTTATTFGTWDETKRGDFAIFLHRADAAKAKVEAAEKPELDEDDFFHSEIDWGTVSPDETFTGPAGW